MRRPEALTVTRLDGPAAEQAEADFTLVYADAFAEPPCRETEHDVAATFQRFRSHTRKCTRTPADLHDVMALNLPHPPA
ncbi:hypothetical protein [Streptomyces noursei]|uniref:hypothetical protein n=1 Tax=Streptomyces noursei TaxID=1971 RepID=UPI001996B9A0|nr:hypothetical protein [Streptomyces noursei]MCZ1020466.1 hypothetical protein [Streptomyces noursei]GGX13598.1 hypothetical protein GCM10010341_38930 [Streptomyces noursei]